MSSDRCFASDPSGSKFASAFHDSSSYESVDPQISNTNGWHWYSASQMPATSLLTHTVTSHPPQHQYHWQTQRPAQEEQRNSGTRPIIFPVRDDLSSPYPSSLQVRTSMVPHTFPAEWPIPPTSSMRRSFALGVNSGKYSDDCPNPEGKLDIMRNMSVDSSQPKALRHIVYQPVLTDTPFSAQTRALENTSAATWNSADVKYARLLFNI